MRKTGGFTPFFLMVLCKTSLFTRGFTPLLFLKGYEVGALSDNTMQLKSKIC